MAEKISESGASVAGKLADGSAIIAEKLVDTGVGVKEKLTDAVTPKPDVEKVENYFEQAARARRSGNETYEARLLFEASLIVVKRGFEAEVQGTPEQRYDTHIRYATSLMRLGKHGSNYPAIKELRRALDVMEKDNIGNEKARAEIALALHDELISSAMRAEKVGAKGSVGRSLYNIEKEEWIRNTYQTPPQYAYPYGLEMAFSKVKEALALRIKYARDKEGKTLWTDKDARAAETNMLVIARSLCEALVDTAESLGALEELDKPILWRNSEGYVAKKPYKGFETVGGWSAVPIPMLRESIELLDEARKVAKEVGLQQELRSIEETLNKAVDRFGKETTVTQDAPSMLGRPF